MLDLLAGRFGKIHAAKWLSREEQPIVLIEMNEELSEYEILVYTDFDRHNNIIHTFGFVGSDHELILLLQDRAIHGNLQVLLERDQFKPSEKVLVAIFLQIIEAMI